MTFSNKKQKLKSPRYIAITTLINWYKTGHLTMPKRESFLERRDYSFTVCLIQTCLRHQSRFHYFIEILSGKKHEKLDIEAVSAINLGMAQLSEISGVPAHAAIFETVALLPMVGKSYLKKFVNAILRRYQREEQALLAEVQQSSLAIWSSHPE